MESCLSFILRHIASMLYSLTFILLGAHVIVHHNHVIAHSLVPRVPDDKLFGESFADPYTRLFCVEPLPQRVYGSGNPRPLTFPATGQGSPPGTPRWSHLNFTGLHDLCSKKGNPMGNLGGAVRNGFLVAIHVLIVPHNIGLGLSYPV